MKLSTGFLSASISNTEVLTQFFQEPYIAPIAFLLMLAAIYLVKSALFPNRRSGRDPK